MLLPTELLTKPGRLNTSNSPWSGLSQAGYNILKSIEFPWPIAKTVLRIMKGWMARVPDQVRARDPVEARILAVADVVELCPHIVPTAGSCLDKALDESLRTVAISTTRG